MKKVLIFLLFLICSMNFSAYSQIIVSPDKRGGWDVKEKEDNDFMYNVVANPDFSLYYFYLVGIKPDNTILRDCSFYTKNKALMRDIKKNNWNLEVIYKKVSIAFELFKKISYYSHVEIVSSAEGRSSHRIFSNPYYDSELHKILNIVPLELVIKE